MATRVPAKLRPLLAEVIASRLPELGHALRANGTLVLSESEAFALQQVLGDEFCATGLEESHEPNARGLELEDLIDLAGAAGREG